MMSDEPRPVSRGRLGRMGPAKTRLYPECLGILLGGFHDETCITFLNVYIFTEG